jgi:hypothetical protein
MQELINQRSENTKTYDLGNGTFRQETCIGAIHYKDDYKDNSEQWKEIDLTLVDGKITKAPYILEIKGNEVTVTDKKSGKVSVVELTSIGTKTLTKSELSAVSSKTDIAIDTDYQLVVAPDSVRFQRIIKSEKAPLEATFKISGDIPISYSAIDADNKPVSLQTYTKDGVLKETLTLSRDIKYPIKVDPTLTVQGSGIDNSIFQGAATTNYGTDTKLALSGSSSAIEHILVNMSLSELPVGATITTATFSLYYYAYLLSYDPNGVTLTLYKCRRADWHGTQSTWNIYKTSNNWGTAGASNTTTDIDTSKTATANFGAGYGWLNFNVKAIVEDAVANSVNFNIRGSIASGDYVAYLYSREYATDTTLRPKLVIEYTEASTFKPQIIIF